MLQQAIVTIVDYCTRYAVWIIGIAVVLGLVTAVYAARHFAIDADVNKLISKELPWRQREVAFEKSFPPKEETILAVIDAPTSELVTQATAALIEKLSCQKDHFRSILEAGGGPFFQKNGLLFLPTEEVVGLTKKLGEAKPIIQTLAQDSNLRGLTTALNYGLIGARMGHYTLDDFSGTLNMVSDTLDEAIAGRTASFSWRAMLNGRPATPGERRRIIGIRPVLDYSALMPGKAATDGTRRHRRRGIRHPGGGAARQHHGDHPGRADHHLACAALVRDHLRGLCQPAGRPVDHCRDRARHRRRAQPDLGGIRRSVHRPRRGFRDSVQRPLPRRTPRGRRPAQGAAQCREVCGRAADACRGRDRRRLPVLPSHRLQGAVRA